MSGVTAVVLAGSRGPDDPMARAAGVSHKALLPVAGIPMLARVVAALAECPEVGRIVVSIEDPGLVASMPELAPFRMSGRLETLKAEASPSLSALAATRTLGTPLLVTTADHALLRPEWVSHFLARLRPDADITAALARAKTVLAAAPDTKRTFVRFSDGAFSGCNLFHLAGPRAEGAVALWRQVETHRKKPTRLVRLLGLRALVAYALGRLTLCAALARLHRLSGARGAIVEMPFGEAAIDVDKPEDLTLVETILARPEMSPAPPLPRKG